MCREITAFTNSMIKKLHFALMTVLLLTRFGIADARASSAPPVTKLQRFRKALWTVPLTVKGRAGAVLFDPGGGATTLREKFLEGMD